MIAAAPVSMLAVYSGGGAPLLLESGMGDALERGAFARDMDDRRRFREWLSGFSVSVPSAVTGGLGDTTDNGVSGRVVGSSDAVAGTELISAMEEVGE